MQRRNINTVVCVTVTIFIVLAASAVAIILLRNDTSSNSTLLNSSSSTGSAIQLNTNNPSVLEHNTSTNYPWTLTGNSSNKTDNNNKDEIISDYHDGRISDFISITDIARDITPIKSTRSNKCTDINESLMRFTLTTDNYPVRFVCNSVCCNFLLFVHIICSYDVIIFIVHMIHI